MWVVVGTLFGAGFGLAIGLHVTEYRREAPVDTYRRLVTHAATFNPPIPQAAIYPVPKCPVCDVEMQGRVMRWDRPYPVAFFCMEHGSERVEVR